MNGKRMMNRKYGNAQTIGSNIYQNTYFMSKDLSDCFLTVMADGTIDSVTGAYASILACESVAKGFMPTENIGAVLERQFIHTALRLNDKMYRGRPPRVSLLAACFYQDQMLYRGVGELSVVCFDGSRLSILSGESGKVELHG